MSVPQTYRKSPAASINYDFQDVLRGNSYIQFFAGKVNQINETDEVYEGTADETPTGNGTDWFAQSFKVGQITSHTEFWITDVSIRAEDSESTRDFELKIQALDGNGKPDGVDLAKSDTQVNFNNAVFQWEKFNLQAALKVSQGDILAIVLDGVSLNYRIEVDGSSPTYADGDYFTSADSGGTWTKDTTKDMLFRIHGVTTNPYFIFTTRFDSDPEQETLRNKVEFDLEIAEQSTIEGDAIINLNTSGQTDIKAELFRIRDGNELSIGANTTNTDSTRKAMGLKLSRTKLVKGDLLRLAISSATGNFTIDYSDNDSSTEKNLIMYIPFKTNI
jgi:hypothetical protein